VNTDQEIVAVLFRLSQKIHMTVVK
jgi:hypothetical protein